MERSEHEVSGGRSPWPYVYGCKKSPGRKASVWTNCKRMPMLVLTRSNAFFGTPTRSRPQKRWESWLERSAFSQANCSKKWPMTLASTPTAGEEESCEQEPALTFLRRLSVFMQG